MDKKIDRIANLLERRAEEYREGHAIIAVALQNGLSHIASVLAVWRMGSTILAVDPTAPASQMEALFVKAGVRIVICKDAFECDVARTIKESEILRAMEKGDRTPVDDKVALPGKLILSGGSTGIPKFMADNRPWLHEPGCAWGNVAPALGFRPGQVQLVTGSMSHNAPLTWAHMGLFERQRLILMEKFDSFEALKAIDVYKVQFMVVVPTMMVRMLDCLKTCTCSFGSIESLYHTGAPCPIWLKEAWIEILGPDRVFEMYGSGENAGQTIITGKEWLQKRGSVGRPFECDVRIYDENQQLLPAGTVGAIYMKQTHGAQTAEYLDPEVQAQRDRDGYQCFGDIGWVDDDGFVFLEGRRDDIIISGGVKIHPERVEAALLKHPAIVDVAVFGVDDRDWGQRVHALIVPKSSSAGLNLLHLRTFCLSLLSAEQMPKSISFTESLPRDGFGKLNTLQLPELRTSAIKDD